MLLLEDQPVRTSVGAKWGVAGRTRGPTFCVSHSGGQGARERPRGRAEPALGGEGSARGRCGGVDFGLSDSGLC